MKEQLLAVLKSFTSRKFLVAVLTAALLFFDKKLGLGLNLEEKAIAAAVGAFWILAESTIDFKAVKGGINVDKVIERMQRVLPIVQEVMKRQNAAGLAFPDFGAMAQEIARGAAAPEGSSFKFANDDVANAFGGSVAPSNVTEEKPQESQKEEKPQTPA